MAVTFICDGCGKQEPGIVRPHGVFKPAHWYQRSDNDGVQIACSRACIDKISDATGKTRLVSPF